VLAMTLIEQNSYNPASLPLSCWRNDSDGRERQSLRSW
jgi:hypothetical protein